MTLIVMVDLFLQAYFRNRGVGVANQGISFGWLPDLGVMTPVVVYLFLVAWFIRKTTRNRLNIALFAIVLGGLGNLLSRILVGSVWDYLSLPLLPFSFNLSDVLISGGVVSYILGTDGNTDIVRRR